MKPIYCHLIILPLIVIFSCTNKLLSPLKGEVNSAEKYRKEHNIYINGNTIYLEPRKTLAVRAVEDCQIMIVDSGSTALKFIVAKGKNDDAYGNFSKCFVSKGGMGKRGRIIGELF